MLSRLATLLIACLLAATAAAQQVAVDRFAELALTCLHQEYPNKIAHVMASDDDVGPPRELTPIFYGCFDWHSSVHGHWLLVRLLRLNPSAPFAAAAEAALEQSFQPDSVVAELAYMSHDQRASFERPYGVAWLLQLMAELREWDDPRAQRWRAVLEPLERAYAQRMMDWLGKLAYPIRTGEHAQTAFAFALFIDWARASGDQAFLDRVTERARAFHSEDRNCPLSYEPGGQDFLSPCLAEADLMRRVLAPAEYAQWLAAFLPQIPADGSTGWLPLAEVTDRSDGKLAHLDGLHLSRAWALEGMAAGLPERDLRRASIRATAAVQGQAGLAAVTGEHYEGGHWLGSFATYLVTGRGSGIAPDLDAAARPELLGRAERQTTGGSLALIDNNSCGGASQKMPGTRTRRFPG
jgi:hypothetical protein